MKKLSISSSLESCTSSILNDLDLIPENDPHYSEINDDVFEKNSDSGVSPEKVEAKSLRRSARAASVASSEKKIKTPTRNRSVRAASKDIDNSESGLHDVDPKRTQRACGRVTRSSSFVASDTSDLEESVSFLTKSIRRTPARGVNNDNLNVIKEESLENSGINSVNTEFPMETNAEVTITPSKRGRSAKATRLSVKKISASPPRLTRAMRAAGLTTPVQEKELDIVQSAEVSENINDSKQVVVASGEKLHNKERFDLETPIRDRNEKFSKNLIHMLMNSTGKEIKLEKMHTSEVRAFSLIISTYCLKYVPMFKVEVTVEVPQSVLGASTPENEIEDMDWESMETPVSQKKVIPTSNDTTPLTHPTSRVDSANVYTPLITKSTDEHERFVEIVTQSVEKANQIMGKGNRETPSEFGTKEIKNNPDSISSEPVDIIHTTTSNVKQPEEYRRSIGTNEDRKSSINQESFNLVNDNHSVSFGLKNDSNDAGLSKEIDSNDAGLSKEIDSNDAGLSKEIDSNDAGLSKEIDSKDPGLSKEIDSKDPRLSKEIDSKDPGLSKEIDSNEINEIAEVMQGAGSGVFWKIRNYINTYFTKYYVSRYSDESLAESGALLFSTVECNSNSTLSGYGTIKKVD
uniref:BTB domain-containing protein n=1 Tax=Heterorhabditis bacteriophora TaxID=37862 RepID=A0A1I7W9P2_HETBA